MRSQPLQHWAACRRRSARATTAWQPHRRVSAGLPASRISPVFACPPASSPQESSPGLPRLRLVVVPHHGALRSRRTGAGSSQPHSWHAGAAAGGSSSSEDSYTDAELETAELVPASTVLGAPAAATSSIDEEGRWHDVMHRALMESLQPPRSEHPSFWGKRYHNLQVHCAGRGPAMEASGLPGVPWGALQHCRCCAARAAAPCSCLPTGPTCTGLDAPDPCFAHYADLVAHS